MRPLNFKRDFANRSTSCDSIYTMRFLLAFSILVTTTALHTGVVQAGPSSNAAPSCGLGLPPGAPGYAEAMAKEALEAQKNGYFKVCDANLERYQIAFRPLASTAAGLAFQPVDLSATEFAHFVSLGGYIESDDKEGARLYRGFRTTDGHTVTLSEHDMSVDGTTTWRDPKNEPERVNGLPARLSVLQTSAGKAVSHLSWVERRRDYEFWIDANVAGTPLRERLFALAASLPPSVPGCPRERPPKPMRIGENGSPVHDPMPLTMTRAEMDLMFDSSQRPCK